METIIVNPKSATELKEVLTVLKKMKVKMELYKEPSKNEILASIQKGAKAASAYINGKKELKDAKSLLNEL